MQLKENRIRIDAQFLPTSLVVTHSSSGPYITVCKVPVI